MNCPKFFNDFFVWWVHPELVSIVGYNEHSQDLSQNKEQHFLILMLGGTLDISYMLN